MLRDESGAIGRNCQASVSVRSVTNMGIEDTPRKQNPYCPILDALSEGPKEQNPLSHYISMCHHHKKK